MSGHLDMDDIYPKESGDTEKADADEGDLGKYRGLESLSSDVEKQSPSSDLPPEIEQPRSPHLLLARWKAWRRVAGAWLLFIVAWGPALAYGSFQTFYSSTLLPSYSDSQLAWIGSLGTLLLVCAGAFAGPLFDRGYLKHILVLGCIIVVFALEMLSLCTQYYQLILAQGIAYGLGSGLVYVPALAFVTASFEPEMRPYAVGVLTSGAGLAGVLYPIMIDKLIPEIGFGWTCRLMGFFSLALAIVGLIMVMDAPTKSTKPRLLIDWKAFTEVPFACMCLISFLQFLGYWYGLFSLSVETWCVLKMGRIPLFYVASFASSKLGVSRSGSLYFICYISAGSVLGRLAPAPLVAKFGAFPMLFAATGSTAIILFCWIAVASYTGFTVWCIAIGFTSGMFVSVDPVVFSLPIISPPEVLGTRFGIIWFCAAVGALIGTPIAGELANPEMCMFLYAQIFTGCILLAATAAILVPWHLYRRDMKRKAQG